MEKYLRALVLIAILISSWVTLFIPISISQPEYNSFINIFIVNLLLKLCVIDKFNKYISSTIIIYLTLYNIMIYTQFNNLTFAIMFTFVTVDLIYLLYKSYTIVIKSFGEYLETLKKK